MEILRKTQNGNLIIDEKAICDIATISINKIKNVYPNKKDDKFIKFTHKENKFNLEIFIKLKQGIDVNTICTNIQNQIYESIYELIDIKIDNIDINIQGFVK